MGTLAEFKNDEIGDLLLRVQDEIKHLKNMVSQEGSKIDIKSLQTSLAKTEHEIKQKSDYYINQLNSQVKVIPSSRDESLPTTNFGGTIENIWDMSKKYGKSVSAVGKQLESRSMSQMNNKKEITEMAIVSKKSYDDSHVVEEVHELKRPKFTPFNLSPGQQVKAVRDTKFIFNPENCKNREALYENYSIQLPLIEKKNSIKVQTHVITGSTVDHLASLPLNYRRNPTLIPPAVSEIEATRGILSLIQRGLLPEHAKISFEHFPIATKAIQPKPKQRQKVPNYKDTRPQIDHIFKLDPNYTMNKNKIYYMDSRESTELNDLKKLKSAKSKLSSASNRNSFSNKSHKDNQNHRILRPPTTPMNNLQIQAFDSLKYTHKFLIQNGRVRTDMAEYSQFKSSFILRWGSIVTVIKHLENLCQNFSISMGYLNGQKVAELSKCVDMDLKPSLDELLDTFINKDEVESIVRSPGRVFKRKDGLSLAAIRIQCAWRRFRDRRAYLAYRKRKWAAGVIALTWLTFVKMSKAREKLKVTRLKHLENFKKRQQDLVQDWPRLKNSRRVIVHIPSLGFTEAVRAKMLDLEVRENYQMPRICDIADENVDVIYVSPIAITEETLQYYLKLLGLKKAIETGDSKDVIDLTSRYKIVVPEALKSFPTHNMALSTILKYSPKALERIKNLIKGRDAYIVPGIMNHDDLHVSDVLNIPILGSEPQIANLYSTKSGSKRIFQSAEIAIPFGEYDIYNKEQLYETLAQAIVDNLNVQRWLFKIDDEVDGRGSAYCDITNLSCYQSALKEMLKFGDKWSKRWAHEPTYVKILEEIPELLENYARPVNTQAYENWKDFLKNFLAQGGVLEAHPPSDSITSLTVSMLIEPDGMVKIITSGDHLHAESQYSCWGYTFPQTSAEHSIINQACLKIAKSCKQRNIMGFVNVDFLTYIDSISDEQILWAVDLNLYYSNIISLSSLIAYLTNGKFDPDYHIFEVLPNNQPGQKKIRKRSHSEENTNLRYACMSNKLHHSNLSVIHYSVFFQTCRALGIGYDIKEKQGTIFTLVDSLNHENMGMITIADNLQVSMQNFSQNLVSLHQEISSESMQGKTNFLKASQEIKQLLESSEEDEEESVPE